MPLLKAGKSHFLLHIIVKDTLGVVNSRLKIYEAEKRYSLTCLIYNEVKRKYDAMYDVLCTINSGFKQ